MKIITAGYGLESSSFTPLRARQEDFTICIAPFISEPLRTQIQGIGIEPVETILIHRTPHGMLGRKDHEALRDRVLSEIESALPADGILLLMHGSMLVEDGTHGELDLLRVLRERIGWELPISVRLDLHGNVPPEMLRYAQVFTALRTAPHRDGLETVFRAAHALKRVVENKLQPVTVSVRVPLLLPGELVITEVEPARSLYALIPEMESDPKVLAASIMVGFAWADSSFTSSSVIVTALDEETARAAAGRLAQEFWNRRHDFAIDSPTCATAEVAGAVRKMLQNGRRSVFVSDSGDNLTAGAPGTSTVVLAELLKESELCKTRKGLFCQLWDEELCRNADVEGDLLLWGEGSVERPIAASGKLIWRKRLREVEVCLFDAGGLHVLVTDKREPLISLDDFRTLGIELTEYDLVVLKLGYLMPELRDMSGAHLMVLSSGPTSLDVFQLSFRKIIRPIYPLDRDMAWSVEG